jgi:DNA-binding beta-propeller fold protein YncE
MSKQLHSRRAGLIAGALLLSAALAPQLAAQNLFVSSTNTKSVLEYDGEDGEFEGKFARGGGLIEPEGLAFSPHDGDLLVSSRSNEVLRYDEKGNFKGVFASGNGLSDPAGIAFCGPDDDLYVGTEIEDVVGSGKILRFDGDTGEFIGALTGDAGVLVNPEVLVCGPDDKLYVTNAIENDDGQVLRYNPGTFDVVFIDQGPLGIEDPTGMVFGPDNNWYVSSAVSNEVRRFDVNGVPVGTGDFISSGSCGLNESEGLVFLPNGHLLVASELGNAVIEFSSTGGCIGPFVTEGSGNLSEPTFLALGPSDDEAENDAFTFRTVPKQ